MSEEVTVKFLTGAPENKSLQWDVSDLTVPLLPSFTSERLEQARGTPPVSHPGPVWRAIVLQQHHLVTKVPDVAGYQYFQPQDNDTIYHSDETSFLDTRNLSFVSSTTSEHEAHTAEEVATILTHFYEHSFAVHQDVLSSQIIGVQSSDDASFLTVSSELSTPSVDATEHGLNIAKHIPSSVGLTNLRDIPNAAYLRSINPQTMTVNLIFGIISVPLPRLINTRRGRRVELIEMIVADETKAGFGINLWLPPTEVQMQGLGPIAATLRPQDIILARNVALSVFRNNVYGQSLRRDLTKLDLLYRNVVDKLDNKGAYSTEDLGNAVLKDPQITKVRKVREWIMQFVGGRPKLVGIQPVQTERLNQPMRDLPPDTQ